MIGPAPVCMKCAHFRKNTDGWGLKCDAFPDGIPDSILVGGNDHTRPVKGDHGIRFEPTAEGSTP